MEINYVRDDSFVELGDLVITNKGIEDKLYIIISVNFDEFNYGLLNLESFEIDLFFEELEDIEVGKTAYDTDIIRNIIKSNKSQLTVEIP